MNRVYRVYSGKGEENGQRCHPVGVISPVEHHTSESVAHVATGEAEPTGMLRRSGLVDFVWRFFLLIIDNVCASRMALDIGPIRDCKDSKILAIPTELPLKTSFVSRFQPHLQHTPFFTYKRSTTK